MRARTVRSVFEKTKTWTESFTIEFAEELDRPWRDQESARDSYEFDFQRPLGPLIAYMRPVSESWSDWQNNRWAAAFEHVPTRLAGPIDPGGEVWGREAVWDLIEKLSRVSVLDRKISLYKRLRKMSPSKVAAFQTTLWKLSEAFVQSTGHSWAESALVILNGRDAYSRALAGNGRRLRALSGEFEELLDLAETALGAAILLPDGSTARSTMRDPEPSVDEIRAETDLRLDAPFGPPEWTSTLPRWEGWRGRFRGTDGYLDVVTIVNRPWRIGLAQMAHVIAEYAAAQELQAEETLQVVFSLIRRPGVRMPPFFVSTHAGSFGPGQ